MASNVIVLTPNGRRQNVKVTPNTTILQIIEEACAKQGFKAEEFDIKHHRKVLDTTSTIRFSGLPNNALLELAQASVARKEEVVILVVQLEDGKRVMGNFLPSNSLWDVLSNLCMNEIAAEQHPVVIYMRQEISGRESFEETSLKSLGLMGGRAMLRLIHRSPEILRTQANVSAPLPVKPVEEKPYIRQLIKSEPVEETKPMVTNDATPVSPKPMVIDDAPAHTTKDNNEIICENVVKKPPVQQKHNEGNNLLNTIKQEKRKQTEGQKIKNHTTAPVVTKQKSSNDDFVFLGERNAMVFSLETAQNVRSDDLPDDFFELSITDIKKLFRDIKKQRMDYEHGGPLLTARLRELEDSKKQLRHLNQYKKTVIRVQFPTRVVLQGIFTPTETIEHVMEFVRCYLADTNFDFHLFTTPPKQILSKESRLVEVNCVPSALLHFGSEVKHETYLQIEILDKISSTSQASFAATKARSENKREIKYEEEDLNDLISEDVNVGASTSSDNPATYEDYDKKPINAPPEKVPKWFKPTK